ncbi:MAG: protein TolR [Deltaproteobacteria bacterium]|nr:protein TolR [Deltaproteobacteria bacterium]
MNAGSNGSRRYMAQINVTPLVDVMLVLLIIFMVTAPMMTSGIDVNLPKVEAASVSSQEEPLVVTIAKDGRIFIADRPFERFEIRTQLEILNAAKVSRLVLLRADETIPYGAVLAAMAEIRKAGVEKIGMMTEPPEK